MGKSCRIGSPSGGRVGLQLKSGAPEPLQPGDVYVENRSPRTPNSSDARSMSSRSDSLQSALISIGILCFNARDTILRALRSALAQDWPSIEVIIVDDCSTDGSAEIVARAIADEPRARLVRHSRNTGAGGARNTVIAEAHGAFIAFFDDDDDSVPDRLRAQCERLTDYERDTGARLVFCYANRTVVEHSPGRPHHVARAVGRTACEPHGLAVVDYIFGVPPDPRFTWGMLGSCTLMARRETFRTVGPFDESFRRCAEWDMAVRGALLGAHFIAVDRPLVIQYKTLSADKKGAIPLKYSLQLRTKHRDYLEKRNFYLASKLFARYVFYRVEGRVWRSQIFWLLGMALTPHLMGRRLRSRAHALMRIGSLRSAGS